MTASGPQLSFPWGAGATLDFTLPEGWELKAVLKPNHPAALPELGAELGRALKNPIGSEPLSRFARRGKTACVVIDDRTRPTPVAGIMPRVLDELREAGLQDQDITILIALGTHRDMTEAEISERVGPGVARRVRVVNHKFDAPAVCVPAGKTRTDKIPVTFNRLLLESDTVVSIGCIEAHEQAGFGGGYKNLMPGCSGPEPIYHTHNARFQKPERISSSGMPRERCRFRRAVDECGELLGPKVFIVNAVLDPVRPVAIVAGHPVEAHAAGCKIYRDMASVRLDAPADVVIANTRPLDLDLRVSMKACFNASAALKPGGLFIMTSAAPEGLGDLRLPAKVPAGLKTIVKMMPLALLEPLAGLIKTSPDQAAGTISLLKILKTAQAWLYLTPVTDAVRPLAALGIEFFTEMDALMRRAQELRPKAQAVAMPQAGASFIAWE